MAKKPDTPCAGCGKLLWTGPNSLPADRRLCLACRRKGAVAPVERPQEPVDLPAEGFGPRGARLWAEMAAERAKMTPPERVLLEEACRTADRLDKLDANLKGRGEVWLRFRAANEDGSIVRVVVDRALSEVRQQQDTLRGIVADLLRKPQGVKALPEEPEVSPSDDLAQRREDRRRASGL